MVLHFSKACVTTEAQITPFLLIVRSLWPMYDSQYDHATDKLRGHDYVIALKFNQNYKAPVDYRNGMPKLSYTTPSPGSSSASFNKRLPTALVAAADAAAATAFAWINFSTPARLGGLLPALDIFSFLPRVPQSILAARSRLFFINWGCCRRTIMKYVCELVCVQRNLI